MPKAIFRFYEELNDYLPKHQRKRDFRAEFSGKRSVIDMIAALGVPHPEIDLILANGKSIGFDHILKDGDRFSVYPVFEAFNIKDITRLREVPIRETRFIVDKNLDDVVKTMRLLGFDVYCDPSLSERELIEISNREKRIILTTNRKLLKLKEITRGIFIPPGKTSRQVNKIIDYLDLEEDAERCEA
ncbi:MAG: Mut7-C RNAse domain-containing protein [Desulfobacterales bacterium]|nr:Mut7-C RNAse domain-containing protein [Desulfobacterales bacterium]